jgi:hypothetical protein
MFSKIMERVNISDSRGLCDGLAFCVITKRIDVDSVSPFAEEQSKMKIGKISQSFRGLNDDQFDRNTMNGQMEMAERVPESESSRQTSEMLLILFPLMYMPVIE